MTCKDCFHKKVCDNLIAHGLPWKDGKYPAEKWCDQFKNKADVVEVVRCKDCKYLYCLSAIDRRFYCRHYPHGLEGINIIEDNPYCSYGERSENGKS